MRQTRRRWLVTAVGAGAAALAGCSTFSSDDGDDDERDVAPEAVVRALRERDGATVPAATPLPVPDGTIERHRERARDTLAGVPTDLSVPNGAVTKELRADRARVAAEVDSPADGSPLDRLSTWRDRRGAAVNVSRAYAAAIGDGDREAYHERRRESLSGLASFEASIEYRAPDPVAATAAYATLEAWTDAARSRLEPRAPFPDEPRSAVFEVGDRWEAVAQAAAQTADARRLRDAYVSSTDAAPHWDRLAATSQRLSSSFRATRERVSEYLDADVSVLDVDTDDGLLRELFWQSTGAVEWRGENAADARNRQDHATAIVEAGKGLVAAETLDRVVEEIEAGDYRTEVSETTVTEAHDGAVAAIEAAADASPRPLAVALVAPAATTLDGVRQRLDEAGLSPERVQAQLDYAARYAGVVPAATTFVADRLSGAD